MVTYVRPTLTLMNQVSPSLAGMLKAHDWGFGDINREIRSESIDPQKLSGSSFVSESSQQQAQQQQLGLDGLPVGGSAVSRNKERMTDSLMAKPSDEGSTDNDSLPKAFENFRTAIGKAKKSTEELITILADLAGEEERASFWERIQQMAKDQEKPIFTDEAVYMADRPREPWSYGSKSAVEINNELFEELKGICQIYHSSDEADYGTTIREIAEPNTSYVILHVPSLSLEIALYAAVVDEVHIFEAIESKLR